MDILRRTTSLNESVCCKQYCPCPDVYVLACVSLSLFPSLPLLSVSMIPGESDTATADFYGPVSMNPIGGRQTVANTSDNALS